MLREGGRFFLVLNPAVMFLLALYWVHGNVYGPSLRTLPDKTVDASVRENPASYRPVVVLPYKVPAPAPASQTPSPSPSSTPSASSASSSPSTSSGSSSSSPSSRSNRSGGGWSGGK